MSAIRYGVIGNTTVFGTVVLGSNPDTGAPNESRQMMGGGDVLQHLPLSNKRKSEMTPQSLEEAYTKLSAKKLGGRNGVSERLVPGVGPVPCKLMFIGEAPGAEEDATGIPFQGNAGKVFDDLLGLSGLSRQEIFATNTFKYRPPDNRDPLNEEIAASLECLSDEIRIVNPKIIIPMGKIAISVFLPGSPISTVRTKLHPANSPNRYIYPTYHPMVVLYDNGRNSLRERSVTNKIKGDFRKLKELLLEM